MHLNGEISLFLFQNWNIELCIIAGNALNGRNVMQNPPHGHSRNKLERWLLMGSSMNDVKMHEVIGA